MVKNNAKPNMSKGSSTPNIANGNRQIDANIKCLIYITMLLIKN